MENTAVKTMKMINFVKKIINFYFFEKNFRLAAGPLSGSSLSGEQSPTADCVGA